MEWGTLWAGAPLVVVAFLSGGAGALLSAKVLRQTKQAELREAGRIEGIKDEMRRVDETVDVVRQVGEAGDRYAFAQPDLRSIYQEHGSRAGWAKRSPLVDPLVEHGSRLHYLVPLLANDDLTERLVPVRELAGKMAAAPDYERADGVDHRPEVIWTEEAGDVIEPALVALATHRNALSQRLANGVTQV